MKLETWNIQGDSGFHFGIQGIGQEESSVVLPSDSLFAALVSQLALIEPSQSVSDWCSAFQADPPFLLTNAFPRSKDVLFFPFPRNLRGQLSEDQIDTKLQKRISFVSQEILRELLKGNKEPIYKAHQLQEGSVLISEQELAGLGDDLRKQGVIWKVMKRPRVTIGRKSSQSNLFHTGLTAFSPGCGLWFGFIWRKRNPDEQERIELLLKVLADSGIGGERSAGFGVAAITKGKELDLPNIAKGPALLLNRYIPQDGEWSCLKHDDARYQVVEAGGWAQISQQKAQRRKSTVLLEAGSVLGDVINDPLGCMLDVRPTYDVEISIPHPIWRMGYAALVGYEGATS